VQPGGNADPVHLASLSVVDQAQPRPIRTMSGLAPASSTTVRGTFSLIMHRRARHLHLDQCLGGGDHSAPDLLQVLQAAQGDLQVVHLSFNKFGRTIRGADRDIPGLQVLAQRGLHPV
jgi:hypothetical protein